jgi:hypothetical protein
VFQTRIKNLVLLVFEDSMEKGLVEGYFYPEWLSIQYTFAPFGALIKTITQLLPKMRLRNNSLVVFYHHFTLFYDKDTPMQKENSRLKSELLEPEWLAKRKLKNLKSLMNQVQMEFLILIREVSPETKAVVIKQLGAFFDMFHWSIDVDLLLLTDCKDGGVTDVYVKHIETEDFFTRLLFYIRCQHGVDNLLFTTGSYSCLGYVCAYNAVEFLFRIQFIFNEIKNGHEWEVFPLLELLHHKLRFALGQDQDFGSLKKNVDRKMIQEAKEMTFPQLLWVVMFHYVHFLAFLRKHETVPVFSERASNSSWMNGVFVAVGNRDFPSLMSMLAVKLYKGEDREDNHPAIVHIKTARKSPQIYKNVLKKFRQWHGMKKADLNHICKLLWMPIQYCANCFKFECTLKICKFCAGDFSLRTLPCWFCSEECENKHLEAKHSEEHEEDVVQRL